jgi:hypothetical protein
MHVDLCECALRTQEVYKTLNDIYKKYPFNKENYFKKRIAHSMSHVKDFIEYKKWNQKISIVIHHNRVPHIITVNY